MPKNRLQETIFTIMMVLVMVYTMICYNIAIETGGMKNRRSACQEMCFQDRHTGKRQTYRYYPCNIYLLDMVYVPYDELYCNNSLQRRI